ncbi:MAG: PIN domain-containing protein [Desulfohalobiaceae bacterium]
MRRCFIDSNIVVYANDRSSGSKQSRAVEIISACMAGGNGVISIQVLQEYANIALKKLGQDPPVVMRQLKLLEAFTLVTPSPKSVRRAVEIRQSYRISFGDAGIIAAAEDANCGVIFSEDLNNGQYYAGIVVVNPLLSGFDPSEYISG